MIIPTLKNEKVSLVVAALFPVFCLAPFVAKAYHMDDTYYIRAAQQILERPWDYYGFSINWYGYESPAYEEHTSPALICYYIAAVAMLFGWNEVFHHAAFLLFGGGMGIGVCVLARRFRVSGMIAVAAAVLTPAFLVSSSNIMLDTPMVAFFTLAVAAYVEGIERNRTCLLWLGALLAGFSALSKYFGICAVGLMAVYAIARKRRSAAALLPLLLPVAMLASEQIYGYWMYGHLIALNAMDQATGDRVSKPFLEWLVIGSAFTGSCSIAALALSPFLWRPRTVGLGAAAGLAGSAALVLAGDVPGRFMPSVGPLDDVSRVQLALCCTAGLVVFALVVCDLRSHRDAPSYVLALWIMGTFVFATYLNWSANVRSFLPIAPAAGLLIARRIASPATPSAARLRTAQVGGLVLSASVAFGVAAADYVWSNSIRNMTAKYRTLQLPPGGTLYFQGHWGFQYYMEELGARAMDMRRDRLAPGDVLVCPSNNSNITYPPREQTAKRFRDEQPVAPFAATMCQQWGAGFYSDLWGPLPFVFRRIPPDVYYTFIIGP